MDYYLTLAAILSIYMNAWFFISLIKKRNDVVDVAWGLGFILMAWASYSLSDSLAGARGILVSALVTIWGLRLSWHIYSRNKGKPEDYRYLAWRESWGQWFYVRSYFQIYVLQGILLFAIVLPVLLVNRGAGASLGWLDFLGVAVWALGFFFETVGDFQLAKFLRNPANKGKIMQEGLWRYTRHPNYFGEVLGWWGIWLIALSVPYGWIGIIGPVTITFFILKVSGVPMLEKKMEKNPEFAEYKRRVNKFFPGSGI